MTTELAPLPASAWLTRRLPPGWTCGHAPGCNPDRPHYVRGGRKEYDASTHEGAHRIAWERWALGVLGPLDWATFSDPPRLLAGALTHMAAVPGRSLWVGRFVDEIGGVRFRIQEPLSRFVRAGGAIVIDCESCVEALVRMGALKLALDDPTQWGLEA